ncbi:TPA: hypothetical protein SMS62_002578 [Pseudomonas aeruginosa]|uniref:hypothetical protein n=1 Tax=Pseudomonas aeruginosa TaxID=287 RepID=UPI00111320DF|nr:hypothetical protein [Pseudomonas aeruginosa]ELH7254677.1 hypothetical protein [Pseudomonas aeruginosa]ELL4392615.1 hypothetical protein [Pseudomonas aeruginosa]MBH4192059.1 hypothetical protein [Pseudomonas aeruginosa]MDI3840466.1 hypothetical protein [Pseudomonas aeruginosa]MDI3863852.1 hypothetical protein [Pseudomonas aeruginosa]
MFQGVDIAGTERRATAYQWIGVGMVILAFVAPMVALTGWLKPNSEALGVWFQRSGAVMTVFSLITGSGIASILNRLSPRGLTDVHLELVRVKFQVSFEKIEWFSLVVAMFGTVIWGYGDVLLSAVVAQ